MNIEIVDQIKAHLEGAPPRLVGIREDGAFGLVKVEASAVKLEGRTLTLGSPILLSDIIGRARGVVSGSPRAVTAPGVVTDLAVGVLAIAAQLGRMSMLLDSLTAGGPDEEQVLAADAKAKEAGQ